LSLLSYLYLSKHRTLSQGEKAGDFTRYLSFHLDLDLLTLSSAFTDDQERKRDDESDIRSETMSEMSDYLPSSAAAGLYGQRPSGGVNPLTVSQMIASEDIDGAPPLPSSSSQTKLSTESGNGISQASTVKRSTSAGRSGGISASSRLSGGGMSRAMGVDPASRTAYPDRSTPSTSRINASQPTTGASSTTASGVRRTSFGSGRSLSGGGGTGSGASKPPR
jgi:hypothetical protein